MQLRIKYLRIDVENKKHALEIIAKIESILSNDTEFWQWDYDIEED